MNYCRLFTAMLRPMYVAQMGWSRMGIASRRRWAKEIRDASMDTVARCEQYLFITDPDVKWVPLSEWKPGD